jgi:hypothetical protein
MANEADRADEIEAGLMDARVKAAREQAKKLDLSNPSGICLAPGCEGETGTERRFCDPVCARAWEKG